MGGSTSFLIFIYDGIQLLKVAVEFGNYVLGDDSREYPLEPENKIKIYNLLPERYRDLGDIVHIEEIFGINKI